MSSESLRRRIATTTAVRELLKHSDGLTVRQLCAKLNTTPTYMKSVLHDEFGFYIDRWEKTASGANAAVWAVVEVPEHCPMPEIDL